MIVFWTNSKLVKRHLLVLAAVVIPILIFYFYSTIASAAGKDKAPSTPVSVASVGRKDIPIYITALGSVTPESSVVVKTQINGQLLQVYFKEGQMVKAGDKICLLYTSDAADE